LLKLHAFQAVRCYTAWKIRFTIEWYARRKVRITRGGVRAGGGSFSFSA
jgi:hypothetical protein